MQEWIDRAKRIRTSESSPTPGPELRRRIKGVARETLTSVLFSDGMYGPGTLRDVAPNEWRPQQCTRKTRLSVNFDGPGMNEGQVQCVYSLGTRHAACGPCLPTTTRFTPSAMQSMRLVPQAPNSRWSAINRLRTTSVLPSQRPAAAVRRPNRRPPLQSGAVLRGDATPIPHGQRGTAPFKSHLLRGPAGAGVAHTTDAIGGWPKLSGCSSGPTEPPAD